MGHLFSRAIKRFTQCNNRNQLPSQEQQEAAASQQQQAHQQREHDSRPIAQAISVGQSIDSAEYAEFQPARGTKKSNEAGLIAGEGTKVVPSPRGNETNRSENNVDKENKRTEQSLQNVIEQDENEQGAQNKPQVEEAVIKIQALVRGHLTRKALKDAQQHAAAPLHNALGQSQFDEDSLTKNSPSAIFMPLSPLNTTTNNDPLNDQINKFGNNSPTTARVPPLESIAEDVETATATNDPHQLAAARENRRKLSPNNRSLAISVDSRPGSISPAASEANASIDLTCDTPASASIDILDHNIRPTDTIASVLHVKAPQTAGSTSTDKSTSSVTAPNRPLDVGSPRMFIESPTSTALLEDTTLSTSLPPTRPANMATITNSHSIDSAEAAAIRIQSAFRGYHTRKHSPYRRRSPGASSTSPPARQDTNHLNSNDGGSNPMRNELGQQNTAAVDNLDGGRVGLNNENENEVDDEERLAQVVDAGRRLSRQRQRLGQTDEELDQIMKASISSPVDNFVPTQADQSAMRGAPHRPSTVDSGVEELLNCQQNSLSSSTMDDGLNNTCVTMLASESGTGVDLSNKRPNLTQGEGSLDFNHQQTARNNANLSIDRNASVEPDTDSSNLGAALSLNEDISLEGDAHLHPEQSPSKQATNFDEEKSDRVSLINDELALQARRLVEQLTNEDEADDENEDGNSALEKQHEIALEKATDQLEAALEEATEDNDSVDDKVAENLAAAILDEEEQRTIELESDDVERRDPSGLVSEDRVKSPPIRSSDREPALVSKESIDDEGGAHSAEHGPPEEPQNQRLGVESPDEAIGSGRSSPALVSSNGGSDSSDEDDAADVNASAGQSGSKQVTAPDEGGRQQASKNKKKNRNRKKGRK